jgi:hypothetical protein
MNDKQVKVFLWVYSLIIAFKIGLIVGMLLWRV